MIISVNLCNQPISATIARNLHFWNNTTTHLRPLTTGELLSCYCLTYLRLLIRLTMVFWFIVSNLGLTSKGRLDNGLDPILKIDYNKYALMVLSPLLLMSLLVFRRDLFWDRSFVCYIPLRWRMEFHLYADDSQIYTSFDSSSCCLSAVVSRIQACLSVALLGCR